jgi:CBS domain-containing protein
MSYRNKTAKDIMQKIVLSLSPEDSLAKARDLFISSHVTGAPVISNTGELVGVFSQTDFLRVLFSEDWGNSDLDFLSSVASHSNKEKWEEIAQKLANKKIRDYLGENIFTASPNDTIAFLAATMRRHQVHRVLIVDDHKVVGIVTTFDILQLVDQ